MRSVPLLTVLILVLAGVYGSGAYLSVDFSSDKGVVSTDDMVLELQKKPDISVRASGSSDILTLSYVEILGYIEEKGIGSWSIRGDLGGAEWTIDTETGYDAILGNYSRTEYRAIIDGIENAGELPTVPIPGNTPNPGVSPVVKGWCSVRIVLTVSERDYTVDTGHGDFTVYGGNETKIDIYIDVLKDAGIDRIAIKQMLGSSDSVDYVLEESGGPRRIVPEYGISDIQHFTGTMDIEQRLHFSDSGKERGHYFWTSYAEIGGKSVKVETYYEQEGGFLILYTSYPASPGERIYHDPVIGVPRISGPVGTVVNAMYEHGMSIAIGMFAGIGAVSALAYGRYRKERKRDDILDFENSEYLRK